MINILSKIIKAMSKFLNNEKVKENLKKILWAIIMEVVDIIKSMGQEQKAN